MIFPFMFGSLLSILNAQNCEFNRSDFSAEWRYDDNIDEVIFSLKATIEDEEFLSGIAFGQRGRRMDFVGVFVKDGEIGVTDSFVTMNGMIREDQSSNVKGLNVDYDNGVVFAEISRPIGASDAYDQDLSKCMTFHFPKDGNVYDAASKANKKLGATDDVEVCNMKTSCGLDQHSTKSSGIANEGNCSYKGKDFTISWKYSPEDDLVVFDLDQSIAKGKRYTAIGIGEKMKDLDVAIVLMEDGHFRALGDYLSGENGIPQRDEVQDFNVNEEQTSTNETSHIQFSRKLDTDDEKDKSLDGCISFQFSVNAGAYDNETKLEKRKTPSIRHRVCDIKVNCLTSSSPNVASEVSESTTETSFASTISSADSEKATGITFEEEITTPSSQPIKECDENHQDLGICQKYFDDYLGRVKTWADRHREPMEAQYWKACKLLSRIAHVPTLCCTLYTATCSGKIAP